MVKGLVHTGRPSKHGNSVEIMGSSFSPSEKRVTSDGKEGVLTSAAHTLKLEQYRED